MPLPEYIRPSDLPQYASSVDRSSFNSAVIGSGDALLFLESGKLIAKKDDGNFYEMCSGGIDVSDTTAVAGAVLAGSVFYDSDGNRTLGSIPTVTASVSGTTVMVPSGYVAAAQTFPTQGIDISDTTAVPGAVLAGYVFHLADGSSAVGTIPTVEATRTENTVSVPSGYISAAQTLTIPEAAAVTVSNNIVTVPVGYVSSQRTATVGSTTDVTDIMPTTSAQILDSGLYLSSAITISGDAGLVASNIASGASIFGVTGTYAGSGGTDVSDTTATPNTVLSGYVFHQADGTSAAGTIPSLSSATITPGTATQILSSGYYLGGDQTIQGDPALLASNIVSGVTIFGVEGAYSATGEEVVPGYIVNSNGSVTFQPLTAGGPAEIVSSLKIVSTGQPEPAYSGGGGTVIDCVPYVAVYDSGVLKLQRIGYTSDGTPYDDGEPIVVEPNQIVTFETGHTYDPTGLIDPSSTTATPSGVLSGMVFYNSQGTLVEGTIPTVSASIVGSTVVVPAGYIATSQTFNISSGSSVDIQLGQIIESDGSQTFVPMVFDGTSASAGTPETFSSLYTYDTANPTPEPSPAPVSMNFYKCASVTAASSDTLYLMSGAGESGCNGTWSATTSLSYDKPIYQNAYGATMSYQGDDTWEIDAPPSDNTVWYIGEGSTDPSQVTNWIVAAGMSPAPSITESSTSTAASWAGYLASIDSAGMWSFASSATSGLTYSRLTPVVGSTYAGETCMYSVADYPEASSGTSASEE